MVVVSCAKVNKFCVFRYDHCFNYFSALTTTKEILFTFIVFRWRYQSWNMKIEFNYINSISTKCQHLFLSNLVGLTAKFCAGPAR